MNAAYNAEPGKLNYIFTMQKAFESDNQLVAYILVWCIILWNGDRFEWFYHFFIGKSLRFWLE